MKVLQHIVAAGLLFAATAQALEPRTWVLVDGRVVEATLESVQGNLIKLLGNDGKQLQFDRSLVSIGDNEYIKENFPDAKPAMMGMGTTGTAQLPMPGKLARIDQKTFKLAAGTLKTQDITWDVMETPHFKVMYQKPVDPRDCGELAERMWIDAAYVHATFPNKFINGQRMAIFLAPTDTQYEHLGSWYVEMLKKAGDNENATRVGASWPKSAAGTMQLAQDIARENSLLPEAQVFRAYRKGNTGRDELLKGVWQPFWTHCLASDMIDVQAGGVSSFGAKGYYALVTGHAYFKEVSYTGRSETGLLRTQSAAGNDVSTVAALADANKWPSELKKLVRKGEVKATMEAVFGLARENADPKGNVLAYAWARYLQSSLPRLANYNKLIQRVATSNQVPEPDDLARLYGFDSASAMEADFAKYLASPEFH